MSRSARSVNTDSVERLVAEAEQASMKGGNKKDEKSDSELSKSNYASEANEVRIPMLPQGADADSSVRRNSAEEEKVQLMVPLDDSRRRPSVDDGNSVPGTPNRQARIMSKGGPGPDDGIALKYVPILSQSPPEFVETKEYSLRYTKNIRILLVVTMYNEGREELDRTLKGVGENLKFLCEKTGVKDFWREVVICIVSDGRTKANPDTIDYMTERGFCSTDFMEEGLKNYKDEVAVHLFESTIKMQTVETLNEFYPPMQIMFALKEKNAGKINSHWWFYMAFASVMQPEYCFLLDVGTTPKRKSFYYMFRAMEINDQVAGVAGEITTLENWNLTNPLVAAQQFEYKISSIFDKTMESMFGYITVLPGAFSAYRWSALAGEPMRMYFHHLITALKDQEPFYSNMYLAEDRILCYELVAKKNCNYILSYVKEAVATTDVPTDLPSLIKQRRRWLNGSLFALIYAILGWKKMMQYSSHHIIRKIFLSFQFLYFSMMVLLQWTAVANYYLTFYFLVQNLTSSAWFSILRYFFLALLLIQFVLGLGNKPTKMAFAYNISAFGYGCFTVGILALSTYQIIQGDLNTTILISVIGTFGSMLIVGTIFRALLVMLASFIQYTFLTSTYIIMFPIYSLCNTHDISWGTKNLDESKLSQSAEAFAKGNISSEAMKAKIRHLKKVAEEENKIKDSVQGKFEAFRSYLLLFWMLTNGLYVSVMTRFDDNDTVVEGYLTVVFVIVCAFILVRTIGAILFFITDIIDSLRPAKIPRYPKARNGQMYP